MLEKAGQSPANQLAAILLAAYLALLLILTFMPGTADTSRTVRVNVRPFASIGPALRLGPGSFSYRQMAGNVAAFVPLGILLPLARPRSSWPAVVLVGAGLSAVIESGQLAVSLALGYGYRAADVDDLILNITGVVIGYVAVSTVRAITR